jgi:hypothetical protein
MSVRSRPLGRDRLRMGDVGLGDLAADGFEGEAGNRADQASSSLRREHSVRIVCRKIDDLFMPLLYASADRGQPMHIHEQIEAVARPATS